MGFLDKARELARGRRGEIGKGLDKAEEIVSKKTGGKYDKKMRSARRKAEGAIDKDERRPGTDPHTPTDRGPEGTPPPR
ncbi:MAG: antitoxin [Streptosporangiales bacterium]|nr:antitoxin [Streptosporangiales bacterium]